MAMLLSGCKGHTLPALPSESSQQAKANQEALLNTQRLQIRPLRLSLFDECRGIVRGQRRCGVAVIDCAVLRFRGSGEKLG